MSHTVKGPGRMALRQLQQHEKVLRLQHFFKVAEGYPISQNPGYGMRYCRP